MKSFSKTGISIGDKVRDDSGNTLEVLEVLEKTFCCKIIKPRETGVTYVTGPFLVEYSKE